MYRGTYTPMWWLPLLGVHLFYPNCSSKCYRNQPTDCGFQDDFCGWKHHNWTRDSSRKGYAFLSIGELSGNMTSEVRCVNSSISHCLKFRFCLNRNNKDGLKVWILYSANYSQSLLWSYSNEKDWTDAQVPVETAADFALIISARSSIAGTGKTVSVDNLKYESHGCKIKPSSATPSTTTSPMTTRATTTTIIGVIVGVIVAMGVVIVVIVVVRQRRDRLRTKMKKNTRAEDNAHHISAFNSEGENITGLNSTRLYHILEPESAAEDPSEMTTGQRLSTETRNPIDNSREFAHQGTAVPNNADDDYNSLDFEKKLGAACVGDVSEGLMDQTYSHLNEVGEDTYDGLSREKKREVLDGVYSRVLTEDC